MLHIYKKDKEQMEELLKCDKGILVLDIGIGYFAKEFEQDIISIDIEGAYEKVDKYKINCRYPNRNYKCISRKFKRKVCNLGYPILVDYGKQELVLKVNTKLIKNNKYFYKTITIPIITNLTKENNITNLKLLYSDIREEKGLKIFCDTPPERDGGWYQVLYKTDVKDGFNKNKKTIIMSVPKCNSKIINGNRYNIFDYKEKIITYSYSYGDCILED